MPLPWLIGGAVLILGGVITSALTENDGNNSKTSLNYTLLKTNLLKLKLKLGSIHQGKKIALIGQPGAGKSSLLMSLTNGKIDPLPMIGIDTDATNWSQSVMNNLVHKYNEDLYIDVPGYDTQSHPVSVFEEFFPFENFNKFVFIINNKLKAADQQILSIIIKTNRPFIIAYRNDDLTKNEINNVQIDLRKYFSSLQASQILFFSNKNCKGIEEIRNFLSV